MDRYADQRTEVRHFRHADVFPSEILDDGTLMIMEIRPGDGIAHLEAGRGVGEIPDGRLYEPWDDFTPNLGHLPASHSNLDIDPDIFRPEKASSTQIRLAPCRRN